MISTDPDSSVGRALDMLSKGREFKSRSESKFLKFKNFDSEATREVS